MVTRGKWSKVVLPAARWHRVYWSPNWRRSSTKSAPRMVEPNLWSFSWKGNTEQVVRLAGMDGRKSSVLPTCSASPSKWTKVSTSW